MCCLESELARLEEEPEAANQRELELLAVIEELDSLRLKLAELAIWMSGCGYDFTQHSVWIDGRKLLSIAPNPPSQALREHEAKVANEILDSFPFFKSKEGLWLADAIAVWTEERRKK